MYFMKLCLCNTEKVAFMSEVLTLVRKNFFQVVVKILAYHLWLKENRSTEISPEYGKVIIGQKVVLQDS